ncbi:unnamed protein product, partial [Ectocarpus sp. 12 AP-2014]
VGGKTPSRSPGDTGDGEEPDVAVRFMGTTIFPRTGGKKTWNISERPSNM